VRVALLFPGQGTKGVLPALDFAVASSAGRALVDRAAAATGLSRADLSARDGRALERTAVLQPVITAVALVAHGRLMAAGVSAAVVAGHSLGEIAAWSAAGGVAPEDAVDVAALRGRLMEREATRRPGGLLALLDGRADALEEALAVGRAHGEIEVGAVNAPDEIVLAGDDAALRAVAAALPSRRLPVAGAWHGPAMRGAVEELRAALRGLPRRPAHTPFVSNRDGAKVMSEEVLPNLLAEQIARPVRWTEALSTIAAHEPDAFVTVGPGAVLRGLVRKAPGLSRAVVLGTEDEADLSRTLRAWKGTP
jgi:[acyl-carrier-protein] S-malonyltransferase